LSAGCDWATLGACVLANPQMVGGGVLAGAVTGEALDRAWGQLGTLIQKASTYVGGQEYQYALVSQRNGLYPDVRGNLVSLKAGEVWKYGTSANPAGRYPAAAMQDLGLNMVIQATGNRYEVLAQEKIMLIGYYTLHGQLPPGNRIFK